MPDPVILFVSVIVAGLIVVGLFVYLWKKFEE
jgi:hypothetical protein